MNALPGPRATGWTTGALLALAAACGPSGFETIPTDQIVPTLQIVENDVVTDIDVWLADGAPAPFPRLEGDDVLRATLGDETRDLVFQGDSELGAAYWARFTSWPPTPERRRIQVDLTRSEWPSAVGSSVELPPRFAIHEDDVPHIARSEPLVISWAPVVPGSTMRIRFVGACAWTGTKEVVDEGRVELTPADWEATQQGTECCRTHLQVDRVVDGVVAPEFGAGGSLEGIQRRSLDRYTFPFPGGSIEGC
jgi:hypothetical protein